MGLGCAIIVCASAWIFHWFQQIPLAPPWAAAKWKTIRILFFGFAIFAANSPNGLRGKVKGEREEVGMQGRAGNIGLSLGLSFPIGLSHCCLRFNRKLRDQLIMRFTSVSVQEPSTSTSTRTRTCPPRPPSVLPLDPSGWGQIKLLNHILRALSAQLKAFR